MQQPPPREPTGAPCLHTMYSYGTRFIPSLVAVTTATSAIEYSAIFSYRGTGRSSHTMGW